MPFTLHIDQETCIGCSECVHGCPHGALSFTGSELILDSGRCDLCLHCLEICPVAAITTGKNE